MSISTEIQVANVRCCAKLIKKKNDLLFEVECLTDEIDERLYWMDDIDRKYLDRLLEESEDC